jgi:hypothetical protein
LPLLFTKELIITEKDGRRGIVFVQGEGADEPVASARTIGRTWLKTSNLSERRSVLIMMFLSDGKGISM